LDHSDDLDLLYYWRVLMRARAAILVVGVTSGLIAWLYTHCTMKPFYRATAVILLRESSPPVLTIPSVAAALVPGLSRSPGASGPQLMALALLKSRRLANVVKRDLKLPKSFSIVGERGKVGPSSAMLKVDVGKEGQILITASTQKPSFCADLANAYVEALDEYQRSDEASSAQHHLHFVETQLYQTKGELETAEDALAQFQRRNQVIQMDASTSQVQDHLWKLDAEIASTRISLDESRKRLAALRPRLVKRAQSEGAPALANTTEIERLRGKLRDVESQLQVERRGYTDEHPRIRELKATADSLRGELRDYTAKSVAAAYEGAMPDLIDLEVAVIAGETKESALQAQRAALQRKASKLPATAVEFARLTREVKVKGSLYEMLAQEYSRAKMAVAQQSFPVVALDNAEGPGAPMRPRVKRNTAVGAFLGFFVAMMVALILDWMRTARNPNPPLSGRERDRAGDEADDRETVGGRSQP